MLENLLTIAAGGAIGAVCRYLAGNAAVKLCGDGWPYGTFIVNIAGCFFMGLLMTVIVDRQMMPPAWRLFLCVGLLGGFTTFSSFGYEAFTIFGEGNLLGALAYAGGSVLLGLIAVAAGVLTAGAF